MPQQDLDISRSEEIILNVLYDRECYGLEIIEIVSQASNGENRINFGSLYPTLKRLSKKRLVESRWGDEKLPKRRGARRRYYITTLQGKRAVDNYQAFYQRLRACQFPT